jgi:hypothetical protein
MMQSVRRCHKEEELKARIEQAMGIDLGAVKCHIVDQPGMTKVMGKSGWSRNQTFGVVGFQVDSNVYVLNSAPWTVLHELIHKSGVNADRLSRYVAEGLTEAIAVELRKAPDEHRPTYPAETKWVQEKLLPRLGMSAVQLGTILAKAKNAPKTLARLMVQVRPELKERELVRELQPQKPNAPSFNRVGRGHVTVGTQEALVPSLESRAAQIGAVLLVSGAALSLPLVFGRRKHSSHGI